MVSMFLLITAFVSIGVLILASIEDFKTHEIPDYLSYFLISAGIVIRILWFLLEKNLSILFWMPISFAVLAGFSYLMYVGGQWGGGDVKILAGISLMLSSFPGETIPFFLNFLLNSLLVGAFYGTFSIGVLIYKNINKLEFKLYEKVLPIIAVILTIALFYYFPTIIAFFGFFLLTSLLSIIYFRKVEKKGMESYIPIEDLTEGDWLVEEVKLNGDVFVQKRNVGLTTEDIEKLKSKKDKIEKVKIKTGIPFVPVFLIGALVTFIFGNVFFQLFLFSL